MKFNSQNVWGRSTSKIFTLKIFPLYGIWIFTINSNSQKFYPKNLVFLRYRVLYKNFVLQKFRAIWYMYVPMYVCNRAHESGRASDIFWIFTLISGQLFTCLENMSIYTIYTRYFVNYIFVAQRCPWSHTICKQNGYNG